jgi:signal transduction histidine kinase
MVILVCTGLSALLYAQRRSEYGTRLRAVGAAEALSTAQARVMVAESTASLGRLAAGLLHELNSPLGALSSGANTLLAVSSKLPAATPDERARLLALQDELSRSLLGSVERLHQVVSRVWSLTSLEESDMLPTDLNELLLGVSSLYDQRLHERGVRVELDLQPMPAVSCRRQQIKAVFTVLLDNAAQAVDNNGWIKISARRRNHDVEVAVSDNGKGIPPDRLESIFSPGFTARGGRVEAHKWGLFSARQIIRGHGGEILIRSEPGSGTEAIVTLPA